MVAKTFATALAASAGIMLGASGALAQDTIKIGIVQSLTGQLTAVGKQIMGGVNLYVQQHGNTVGGITHVIDVATGAEHTVDAVGLLP